MRTFHTRCFLICCIDGLENLETMLHVIRSFGSELPPACQQTCEQTWQIFDAFVVKFGTDPEIADRATRVIRRGLDFFGDSALSVAPAIIARMSFSFEATGFAAYLWIPGKVIDRFGNDDEPNLRGSFKEFYERSTQKVMMMLQAGSPREHADGTFVVHLKFQQGTDLRSSARRLPTDALPIGEASAGPVLPFDRLPSRLQSDSGRPSSRAE